MDVGRQHVLVVDDGDRIRALFGRQLQAEGFTVRHADGGPAALEEMLVRRPDLVVLHLDMPRPGGLDVLRRLRTIDDPHLAAVRIIVVSGRDSEADRIVALDLGADDYVVEMVGPGELAARVRALLRRGELAPEPTCIDLGELHIDMEGRSVTVHGRAVELTTREFDLLSFLARNPGRVYTRHQLLALVWRSAPEQQREATVAEHIRRLRRKLEPDPARPRWLCTVRRIGYQIAPGSGTSSPSTAAGSSPAIQGGRPS